MTKHLFRLALAAIMCLALPLKAAARTTDDILADLKANRPPVYDSTAARTNPGYRDEYLKATAAVHSVRAALILELSQLAPNAPELLTLLPERWRSLRTAHQGATATAEITTYLGAHPDSPIKAAAALTRVTLEIEQVAKDPAARKAALAAFETAAPDDAHLPEVLQQAWTFSTDAQERQGYLERLQNDFSGSRASRFVVGQARALGGVGKPFELTFNDVLTGKQISIKNLKGKVVVIDFWATWCGPCMAEMPNMKKLYAQYRDQGVEFIGVSLDQPGPGLDKLKECLAANKMTWPQFYQGNGWDSAFSASWGVSSIPRVFVIDAQGNLANVAARGHLDTLIPKLLKAAPPADLHEAAAD